MEQETFLIFMSIFTTIAFVIYTIVHCVRFDYGYHVKETRKSKGKIVKGTFNDFMQMFDNTKWEFIHKGYFSNITTGDRCNSSEIKFRGINMLMSTRRDYAKVQKFIKQESQLILSVEEMFQNKIVEDRYYWKSLVQTEKENTN